MAASSTTTAARRYPIHAPSHDEQPLVDITKDQYDLSTFQGRLRHFAAVTSPLTLLASQAELKAARDLVASYERRFPRNRSTGTFLVPRTEAQRYWKAKQLVDSSVHPDTGDVVPLPFRMSAFVPTNLVVVAGMLMPNPTLPAVIFWQWVNQSLNVAVNYANANKSKPMDTSEVATAYAAATTSAVGIAVGLTRLVGRLRIAPGPKVVLGKLVPFASVASAGIVNISCMRWKEIKDGVTVFRRDAEGNRVKVGESQQAGKRAVAMTAASRVLTNIPTLILPPLAVGYLQRRRIVPASGLWARATDLTLIGTSLLVFLPPAIATFPQVATIAPTKLEERFHDLIDEKGERVHSLEFNKGL